MSDETPIPAPTKRPDAVKIPMTVTMTVRKLMTATQRNLKHINFVLDTCNRLLQADLAKGEKVGYRAQPTIGEKGMYFAARVNEDPNFGFFFPVGHGLEGQSRYHWVPQPDGTEFGYLTDEALAELEASRAAR